MHDDDRHVMDQLITRITELERLRVKDRCLTTQLTEQVVELERKCNADGQGLRDDLISVPHMTNVSISNPVSLDDDSAEATDEEQTEIRSSNSVYGHLEKRSHETHTRVSTSLNVVAFQAFLAQTLNGPATAQTIKVQQTLHQHKWSPVQYQYWRVHVYPGWGLRVLLVDPCPCSEVCIY
ncbi:uncharacterized protein [Argopecten irradians]|uniref:uncharacterized protein n=1 Tax=Argopecten irradians TaxID=31199 RepID=UPI0037245548